MIDPEFEIEEYITARREALTQQRSTLSSLLRDGIISEDIFSELATEVDQAITDSQINWLEATHHVQPKNISELVAVIIQEEDVNRAVEALHGINIPIVRMPSAGEFLGRKNTTILIGIPQGKKEIIINTLQQSLRQRVELLTPKKDLAITDETLPEEITIGATLFSFEIERYEEF